MGIKKPSKQRKSIINFEQMMIDTAMPADFSFHGYDELKPVGCENARITRLGQPPERSLVKKRLLTKALWVNNNKLKGIKGLDYFAAALLEDPIALTFLDLSFNYITAIDPVIMKFCNLTILYFHGNNISDVTEVAKLRNLKKLRNLTFHGNPMAVSETYRSLVLAYLPRLVHLDHVVVLKSFRKEPIHPDALKYLKCLKDIERVPCMTVEEAEEKSKEADRIVKEEFVETGDRTKARKGLPAAQIHKMHKEKPEEPPSIYVPFVIRKNLCSCGLDHRK